MIPWEFWPFTLVSINPEGFEQLLPAKPGQPGVLGKEFQEREGENGIGAGTGKVWVVEQRWPKENIQGVQGAPGLPKCFSQNYLSLCPS